MGQNIIQDAANTLPHMVMSERIGYDDLEQLAELPDGMLSIDLLKGEAHHEVGGTISLQIVQALSEWLGRRLGKRALGLHDLAEAGMVLLLRTDRVRTDRARVIPFDWHCTSTLTTRAGQTASGVAYGLTWYDRDRRAT